jgi:hypothetical protein
MINHNFYFFEFHNSFFEKIKKNPKKKLKKKKNMIIAFLAESIAFVVENLNTIIITTTLIYLTQKT